MSINVFSLRIFAQVKNLDEVEILGEWQVVDGDGCFAGRLPIYHNSYKRPFSFNFADNEVTVVGWQWIDGVDYEGYAGYWISHTSDKYVLHILCNVDYDGHDNGISLLNFVVTQFDGKTMTLQTLSKGGNLYLKRDSDTAAIGSVDLRNGTDSCTYTISGIKVDAPKRGIYIRNGEKVIVK